ncbi:NKAP domain containing 1 isoform X2 [Trichomycterus rosablanca]|uniref:NKAP domain containing 1 isoform X2 n=1 Tax=Trichomycterus rosablanca TaxID=2290929 RepID=UPI002F35EE4B
MKILTLGNHKKTSNCKLVYRIIMAKVPMGKVLLRNVIRHTDAHNKIQEESEMWKLRGMERQTSSTRDSKQKWTTSSMHCDRYLNDVEGSARSRLGEGEGVSVSDEQEARYWTRKLYDFEANDPDRWGHSGFKELYPEEFQSARDADDPKPRKNDKKSKKSSKQKKKKKKTKKKKQRTEESDSESDSSAAGDVKRKPKRKSSKSKHRRKKRRKEEDDSDGAGEKPDRKRSRTVRDTQREPERKKRKNWKAANEEKSEESSED